MRMDAKEPHADPEESSGEVLAGGSGSKKNAASKPRDFGPSFHLQGSILGTFSLTHGQVVA